MKKSGSERSNYDDYTDGAVSEFTTRLLPRNTISASVFFKDDTHRSQDAYPGAAPFPKIYPMQRLREQQVSIGFQDALNLTSRLQLTAGLSVDYMKGLFVSGYNSDNTKLIPLTCLNSPKNNSFSGCAARVWTYNPQLSASYRLTATDTLFVIFSDRARFPLLKDSYSYRFQRAWPNPDLGPEHSRNWDIGYSHAFGLSTLLQLEYFHSDLRDAIQSIGVRDASMPAHCPGNSSGSMKGYCSINYNAGKETHEGAEISIRSTPIRRLSLNASYSYINRTIAWDYSKLPPLDQINISVLSLPSMYKNKFVGNAALDLPHHILALATLHYEGGIRLQDTYIAGSGAYGGRYGVVDIGMVAPLWAGVKLQAGIKNLFDRDYYYQAGFPQAGRNSYFNLRHAF
jgi:iron complex outermembrane receptor protein